MARRHLLSVLSLVALTFVAGGCFELTSSSTVDDPEPYQPAPNNAGGHWINVGSSTGGRLIVLGNEFRAATIQNGFPDRGDVCVLYVTVEFTAPYDELMRFQARLTMTNGAWLKSPVFSNQAAGSRQYVFPPYDTRNEGCWGAQPHQTQNLHVAACRGIDCNPMLPE